MRVSKQFQPITITIETKEEADIFEEALETLLKVTEKRGGSWWSGYKDVKLSPEQMRYRATINHIRFALNPALKDRPMFMTDWS